MHRAVRALARRARDAAPHGRREGKRGQLLLQPRPRGDGRHPPQQRASPVRHRARRRRAKPTVRSWWRGGRGVRAGPREPSRSRMPLSRRLHTRPFDLRKWSMPDWRAKYAAHPLAASLRARFPRLVVVHNKRSNWPAERRYRAEFDAAQLAALFVALRRKRMQAATPRPHTSPLHAPLACATAPCPDSDAGGATYGRRSTCARRAASAGTRRMRTHTPLRPHARTSTSSPSRPVCMISTTLRRVLNGMRHSTLRTWRRRLER